MTEPERKIRALRGRAAMLRAVASVPTNGGHGTDRLLIEVAEQLEREADKLESARR